MKKNSGNSIGFNYKDYEKAKVIISENDENVEKSTVEFKKSRNFITKRIKTEVVEAGRPLDASFVSPYSKEKKSK